MGSSRLPGKVLKPFYEGASILELIIRDFQQWSYPIVVATTTAAGDDVLEQLAQNLNVFSVRGSNMNALDRFMGAVKEHDLDFLIRVCADNPFLSQQLFSDLLEEAKACNFDLDYLSHSYDSTPVVLTHFGFFVELVSCKALQKVSEITDDPYYLEHITNYLYHHPQEFKIKYLDLPHDFFIDPDIRLTVDTPHDFALGASIYKKLKEAYGSTEIDAINAYLGDHPEIMKQMRTEKASNPKK